MTAVSVYCERLAPGVLGEPLNTLTNLAFLLAALAGWRRAGRHADQRLLATLLAAIGVGSTLFHAFATALTQLFDVLPIALFQLCYLYLYLTRVAQRKAAASCACLAVYVACLAMASQAPALFNGSLAYGPAALALLLMGIAHWRMHPRLDVLAPALLFLPSLAARSVDLMLCPRWPTGTHFLWHMLNALMLHALLNAYRRATGDTALNHRPAACPAP